MAYVTVGELVERLKYVEHRFLIFAKKGEELFPIGRDGYIVEYDEWFALSICNEDDPQMDTDFLKFLIDYYVHSNQMSLFGENPFLDKILNVMEKKIFTRKVSGMEINYIPEYDNFGLVLIIESYHEKEKEIER